MLTLPNSAAQTRSTRTSIRNHCLAVLACAFVLVFGFGAMGAVLQLSGAVVASGRIVVQSALKKVAHPTGGIVDRMFVEDGTRVRQGDMLIHLDETVARATAEALSRDVDELTAQQARLEAERDGREDIVFPEPLLERSAADSASAHVLAGERTLFRLRRTARDGQRKQLAERITQLEAEIDALQQQRGAKAEELAIVRKELAAVEDLFARNLVQLPRLDALKRDAARIAGEGGALAAEVAQTQGKIAETRLQIIQIDTDMRSDVSRQLADIRAKTADAVGRRIAALDQLKHLDVRAPQDGVVHELAVHAKGAVVAPGEQILVIVPDQDRLVAEVHVAPQDIDKVAPNQRTILRFPSFNQRTTPETPSRVTRIAADTTQDPRGALYYTVQIALHDRVIDATPLRPGMPVEAYIETSDRTVLSYLLKPLSDQVSHAFREN